MTIHGTEFQARYPYAYKQVNIRPLGFVGQLVALKSAVDEMEQFNPKRAAHIRAVAASLTAITQGNWQFFVKGISPEKSSGDQRGLGISRSEFEKRYCLGIQGLATYFRQLSDHLQKVLFLSVWAHDLGVPFGIEWDHYEIGAELAHELIIDSAFQRAVVLLVRAHGHFSDLASFALAKDIERIPAALRPALLLLDFCDAASRISPAGKRVNPIGLNELDFFFPNSRAGRTRQIGRAGIFI